MKKFYLLITLLCGVLTACSFDDALDNTPEPTPNVTEVSFEAAMASATRATDTNFESGDAISVFAVEPSVNIRLAPYGNYADNVQYVYNGDIFQASSPISFDESYEEGLAYFAVYPYSTSTSSEYTFSVKQDQSTAANFTASDLCTAYCAPTTEANVLLQFSHRLSNVEIKFHGDNLASKNLSVRLSDVYTKCSVNINAETFTATGSKSDIVMGKESGNTFHAIMVPQTISSDDTFMIVTVNGKDIALSLTKTTEFKSGKKIVYEYEVKDDKIVEIDGYINPWEEEEFVENYFEQNLFTKVGNSGTNAYPYNINIEINTSLTVGNSGTNAYPYNSLFFEWIGQNVVALSYALWESSIIEGIDDDVLIDYLDPLDDDDLLYKINNGGADNYYFSGLDASTSYTLCAFVTFADGETMFVKSECSTEANPNSNSFIQNLYTSSAYENYGYYDYNSLFFDWYGVNVRNVWYGMFLSDDLVGVSDNVIIDNLSDYADSDELDQINSSSGYWNGYINLTQDTSYTLCAYVEFTDGTYKFYKSTCKTAEVPEEERLEYVVP